MKKYMLKYDTMNESDLQKVYNYRIHPRKTMKTTDIGFVSIDNGHMICTHWFGFYVRDNNSFYFDSFGRQPGEVLLQQIIKPITFHNFKIQDVNSSLWGTCCLYFSF